MFITFTFTRKRIDLIKLGKHFLLVIVIILAIKNIVNINIKNKQDFLKVKSENAQILTYKDYMNFKNINY